MPEYHVWNTMRQRCRDPNLSGFARYGGRGIRVCDAWHAGRDGMSGFETFLADMGRRPTAAHSIDRIDNDGNYEPTNCRWTSAAAQQRNTSANVRATYRGVTYESGADLCEAVGISRDNLGRLLGRISKGWTIDAAVEVPFGLSRLESIAAHKAHRIAAAG